MQDLLVEWFGSTGATVIRYAIALIVVAGLLLFMRWILLRYVGKGSLGMGRGRQNRLAVVDAVTIDTRRRLVLVRRDNVEHLILIGGGTDLVVEPTIIRGVPVGSLGRVPPRGPVPAEHEPAHQAAAEPAAAAAVEPPEAPVPVHHAHAVLPSQAVPAPRPDRRPLREPLARTPEAARPATQQRLRQVEPHPRPAEPAEAKAEPFIPPEPDVVGAAAAAIPPIVEPPVAEPPPVRPAQQPVEASFDDLARQLDEALKSELPSPPPPVEPKPVRVVASEPRPAARQLRQEPAARPEPAVRTEHPVEKPAGKPQEKPAAEAPAAKEEAPARAGMMPAASAWLRPRTTPKPQPTEPRLVEAAKAEPAPVESRLAEVRPAPRPAAEPVRKTAPVAMAAAAPAVEPPTATEPTIDDLDERLASALSEAIAAKEPPEAAAEPTAEPETANKPAEAAPPAVAKPSAGDFSSLEDEMARLLDELAGDSKGKR